MHDNLFAIWGIRWIHSHSSAAVADVFASVRNAGRGFGSPPDPYLLFFPPPKIFLNFVPYYFVWNPKCSFLPSVFTCAIPFSTVNYFFIRQCPIGLECHCEAFFKIPPDFIHFKCLTEPLLVRHRHTSFGFGVILLSC